MVLSRFFRKQQEEADAAAKQDAAAGLSGFGGQDQLDNPPKQNGNSDTNVFRKKAKPKRQASDDDDDDDDDDDVEELEDKSIAVSLFDGEGASTVSDDVTVDTTTSGNIKSRIASDFLTGLQTSKVATKADEENQSDNDGDESGESEESSRDSDSSEETRVIERSSFAEKKSASTAASAATVQGAQRRGWGWGRAARPTDAQASEASATVPTGSSDTSDRNNEQDRDSADDAGGEAKVEKTEPPVTAAGQAAQPSSWSLLRKLSSDSGTAAAASNTIAKATAAHGAGEQSESESDEEDGCEDGSVDRENDEDADGDDNDDDDGGGAAGDGSGSASSSSHQVAEPVSQECKNATATQATATSKPLWGKLFRQSVETGQPARTVDTDEKHIEKEDHGREDDGDGSGDEDDESSNESDSEARSCNENSVLGSMAEESQTSAPTSSQPSSWGLFRRSDAALANNQDGEEPESQFIDKKESNQIESESEGSDSADIAESEAIAATSTNPQADNETKPSTIGAWGLFRPKSNTTDPSNVAKSDVEGKEITDPLSHNMGDNEESESEDGASAGIEDRSESAASEDSSAQLSEKVSSSEPESTNSPVLESASNQKSSWGLFRRPISALQNEKADPQPGRNEFDDENSRQSQNSHDIEDIADNSSDNESDSNCDASESSESVERTDSAIQTAPLEPKSATVASPASLIPAWGLLRRAISTEHNLALNQPTTEVDDGASQVAGEQGAIDEKKSDDDRSTDAENADGDISRDNSESSASAEQTDSATKSVSPESGSGNAKSKLAWGLLQRVFSEEQNMETITPKDEDNNLSSQASERQGSLSENDDQDDDDGSADGSIRGKEPSDDDSQSTAPKEQADSLAQSAESTAVPAKSAWGLLRRAISSAPGTDTHPVLDDDVEVSDASENQETDNERNKEDKGSVDSDENHGIDPSNDSSESLPAEEHAVSLSPSPPNNVATVKESTAEGTKASWGIFRRATSNVRDTNSDDKASESSANQSVQDINGTIDDMDISGGVIESRNEERADYSESDHSESAKLACATPVETANESVALKSGMEEDCEPDHSSEPSYEHSSDEESVFENTIDESKGGDFIAARPDSETAQIAPAMESDIIVSRNLVEADPVASGNKQMKEQPETMINDDCSQLGIGCNADSHTLNPVDQKSTEPTRPLLGLFRRNTSSTSDNEAETKPRIEASREATLENSAIPEVFNDSREENCDPSKPEESEEEDEEDGDNDSIQMIPWCESIDIVATAKQLELQDSDELFDDIGHANREDTVKDHAVSESEHDESKSKKEVPPVADTGCNDCFLAETKQAAKDPECPTIELSGASPNATTDAALSDEESVDVSDSEEDCSSDSSDDGGRVVVKSLPLLRLENVTAKTRTEIPEKDMQKNTKGWGWFARKAAIVSKVAPKTDSVVNKVQHPEPQGTEDAIAFDAAESTKGKSSKTNVAVAGAMPEAEGASVAGIVVKHKSQEDEPVEVLTNPDDNPSSASSTTACGSKLEPIQSAPQPDEIDQETVVPSRPLFNLAAKFSRQISTDSSGQSDTDPLAPEPSEIESSPTKSPIKKKKKKKKGGLLEHMEQTAVRKITRHGDEMSVGTMNFVKKKQNTREIVVEGNTGLFDEEDVESLDEFGSKKRPWGKALPKDRRAQQKKVNEEDEDLENIERFGSTEKFFKEGVSAFTESDDQPETKLPALIENDEEENSKDGNDDDDSHKDEQDDELGELFSKSDAEQKLEIDLIEDMSQDIDFDGVWDDASCDVSTALEFERSRRKKNHEKERKKQKRENQKEEKANAARRLRLFEKCKEKEGGRQRHRQSSKQSRLSDEFIDAIHKVFEDGSTGSLESCSDQSDSDDENQNDKWNASCTSLYLNRADDPDTGSDEESKGSRSRTSRKSKKSIPGKNRHKKNSRHADDASQGFSTASSKHTRSEKSKAASKAKRAKRNEFDASEIFLREVEKLKRPKVLTVAGLRQEMIDRRGTSANLLKKEFQSLNKNNQINSANQLHQLDANVLTQNRNSGFELNSRRNKGGTSNVSVSSQKSDQQPKPNIRSDGLAATLSRWASTEGVSELDDLATVYETTKPQVNLFGVAQQVAKTVVTDAVEGVGDLAKEAGKTVHSAGQVVQEKASNVGKQIGIHLQEGAATVGNNVHSGLQQVQNVVVGKTNLSSGSRPNDMSSPAGRNLRAISENESSTFDDTPMFAANFDAFELPMIQEDYQDGEDDDARFGLLKNKHDDGSDEDDARSYQSSSSKRSMGSIKKAVGLKRLGSKLKKFKPKVSIRGGSKGSNGSFMMDDD